MLSVSSVDMAGNKTTALAKPTTKWDENAHKALCGALLDTLEAGGVSLRAHSETLVESMAERGHPFSWEGIR